MIINCKFSELVETSHLVEHPKNANKHSDKQILLLSKIIEFQGWRHPIIVSNRSKFIVAGHARLAAAKLLGQEKVPVDYQNFDSEAQEWAFLISDNKIAELAESDLTIINTDCLSFPDLDLDLIGIPDFHPIQLAPLDDKIEPQEPNQKFIIEVQFPNDMEMNDVKDDLLSRGYMVKVRG